MLWVSPATSAGWKAFYATRNTPCYKCTARNKPEHMTVSGRGTQVVKARCLSSCPVTRYTVVLNKSGKDSHLRVGSAFIT